MTQKFPTDYRTYKEILDDLLKPISGDGLDQDTVQRLYESKLVYLENLRVKCFREMNDHRRKLVPRSEEAGFSNEDYRMILEAITQTKKHLSDQVRMTILNVLNNIK